MPTPTGSPTEENMAAKRPSIASLIRKAATSEADFIGALQDGLEENDTERLTEYLTRINQPLKFEGTEDEVPAIGTVEFEVTDWNEEAEVDAALTKFHARHMRKLKWYISHPDIESVDPGLRIFNCMVYFIQFRMLRVLKLLDQKEVLNPVEWGLARELLNRALREFREACALATGRWFESNLENLDPDEVKSKMTGLPATIVAFSNEIGALRDRVEERRASMAVQPPAPYPTVRPPRYFGGDLIDSNSWKHYWSEVDGLADTMRNQLDL